MKKTLLKIAKVTMALLCTTAMLFAFSACEKEKAKADDPEPAMTAVPSKPVLWALSTDLRTQEEIDDGIVWSSVTIPSLQLSDLPAVAPETGFDTEPMQSAINLWNEKIAREMSDTMALCTDYAASAIQNGTFAGKPYYATNRIYAFRADTSVMSFVRVTESYLGIGNPLQSYLGYTFDAGTGKELMLSDVVSDMGWIAEKLPGYVKESYEDWLRTDDLERYLMEALQDNALAWNLSREGLVFWFNPGEVAANEVGRLKVIIPLEDCVGHVEKQYLELPDDYDQEILISRNSNEFIVQNILATMSSHERICQLFMVMPQDLSGSLTTGGDPIKKGLEEYPVGGVLFVANNVSDDAHTLGLLYSIKEASKYGTLIVIDEEGGRVSRLRALVGEEELNAMYTYKDQGPQKAYDNAKILASHIQKYMFNMNLAPVADVWSDPNNKAIGDRAYSDDFEEAAELVAAAVRGFHDSCMLCCLKHFPGHGDTATDSHASLPVITKSREDLFQQEFLPFKSGIDAGSDAVMVGHLLVPSLDSVPATISKTIVTDILRNDLGFDGVILSDSLSMGAVNDMSSGELSIAALNAGIDLLVHPSDFKGALRDMKQALQSGEITMERINESCMRILLMKASYGML